MLSTNFRFMKNLRFHPVAVFAAFLMSGAAGLHADNPPVVNVVGLQLRKVYCEPNAGKMEIEITFRTQPSGHEGDYEWKASLDGHSNSHLSEEKGDNTEKTVIFLGSATSDRLNVEVVEKGSTDTEIFTYRDFCLCDFDGEDDGCDDCDDEPGDNDGGVGGGGNPDTGGGPRPAAPETTNEDQDMRMRHVFNIGGGWDSTSYLVIDEPDFNSNLYQPAGLAYVGQPNSATGYTVPAPPFANNSEIVTPAATTKITNKTSTGYDIEIRIAGSLEREFEVRKGTGDVVTIKDLTRNLIFEYSHTTSGGKTWTLKKYKSGQSSSYPYKKVAKLTTDNGTTRVKEITVSGYDGRTNSIQDASKRVVTYTKYSGWGWGKTKEEVYDTSSNVKYTTTITYTSNGRVDTITGPGGDQTSYTYDGEGRISTITLPFENGTSRNITYSYNTGYEPGSDYGYVKTEKVGTTIVAKTYSDANTTTRTYTTKRCTGSSDAWGASSNLVTVTKRDTSSNRITETSHPDGTRTTYDAPTSGTLNGEAYHQTVVKKGEFSGSSLEEGEITTTKISDSGQTLEQKREERYSGTNYTVYHSRATVLDSSKRVVTRELVHKANRIMRMEYDCCGLEWETDERGVATCYERDVLGRVTKKQTGVVNLSPPTAALAFTGDKVTTLYGWDALGNTTMVKRTESPSYDHTILSRDFNLAGEPVWEYDALGDTGTDNQTKYFYATVTGGGTEEVVSRPKTGPSGAQGYPTEHRVYFEDGRLKTHKKYASSARSTMAEAKTVLSGSVIEWIEYDYGATGTGEYTLQRSKGQDGTHLANWKYNYYNQLGNVWRIQTPNPNGSGSAYENRYFGGSGSSKGKVVRIVDPAGVTTHYRYNGRGERYSTLLDDTASGGSFSESYDRRTETLTEYGSAAIGSGTVRRVRQRVYPNEGNSSQYYDIAITETSLDGLDTWHSSQGEVTRHETTLPSLGDGTWTVTTHHADGSDTVEDYDDGRLDERRHAAGSNNIQKQTYSYDIAGRVDAVDDSRFGETTYAYHYDNQLKWAEKPNPTSKTSTTGRLKTEYFYDKTGSVTSVKHPDGSFTYYQYHQNGLLKKQHGARTKDISYTYDGHGGNLKTMVTAYGSGTATATTTWHYHTERGWLVEKEDSHNESVQYTYDKAGKLLSRTWARGVVTNYSYYSNGDLKLVDYSDGTEDVYFTYDRMGRIKTATDGTWNGSAITPQRFKHTYDYLAHNDLYHPLKLNYEKIEGLNTAAVYLTRKYETVFLNRSLGFKVGTSANGAQHHDISYTYKTNDGRLETVASHGDTYTYAYGQYGGGPGDDEQPQPVSLSGPGFTTNYVYQSGRPTLDYQENKTGGGTLVSKYAYEYDSRTRRTRKKMTGTTLFGTNGKRNVYGYNDDDEADEADRYNNATSGGTLADDWTYTYDGIGNRLSAVGPDTGDGANISYTYTPGSANEYTQIKRGATNRNPAHDKDGNMTDRGNLDFIWNGENRLKEVRQSGTTIGTYEYDYLGRRVKRTAGGATETYVYDGWNLAVSYTGGSTRKHTYTWGTDNGTGGIGALIACRKISNGKDHVYFYDGHGNVTQVMNQSGTIVAHYEYDAFGNLTKNVNQDGSGFNDENPFRFSTKFFNDETDHYYYGYRHYDPRDGRWLNRDPIGERGGANLYAFVGNNGMNWMDYLGREPMPIPTAPNLRRVPTPQPIPFPKKPAPIRPGLGIILQELRIIIWQLQEFERLLEETHRDLDHAEESLKKASELRRRLAELRGQLYNGSGSAPGPSGDIDPDSGEGAEHLLEEEGGSKELVFHYGRCGKEFLTPRTWVTNTGGLRWDQAISITYLEDVCVICEYKAVVRPGGVAWEERRVMGFKQGRLTFGATPISVRKIEKPD